MTASAEWKTGGRLPTFSFYLTAHACKRNPEMAFAAAELADGLTIAGHNASEVAKQLRDSGLEIPLLIDGMGYKYENLPTPAKWVQQQILVGAARSLLPGVFIPWEKDSDADFAGIVKEQGRIAEDLGAMILAAVDVRLFVGPPEGHRFARSHSRSQRHSEGPFEDAEPSRRADSRWLRILLRAVAKGHAGEPSK